MRRALHRRWQAIEVFGIVALIATPLILMGARVALRPNAIRAESFQPSVPLEGPYTAEELRQAETKLAGIVPPEQLLAGLSPEQLEAAAEATRKMEALRKEIWEREREVRLHEAIERRPVGWLLLGLGVLLAGAWGSVASRLFAKRGPRTGSTPGGDETLDETGTAGEPLHDTRDAP